MAITGKIGESSIPSDVFVSLTVFVVPMTRLH